MLVALGSIPACVFRGNGFTVGGDAAVGDLVPLSPPMVGKTRSYGSLAHTTRPSTNLLLNKLFETFVPDTSSHAIFPGLNLSYAKEDLE